MPAWKDADGGTTFCADTEVGSRWGALEREKERELYLKSPFYVRRVRTCELQPAAVCSAHAVGNGPRVPRRGRARRRGGRGARSHHGGVSEGEETGSDHGRRRFFPSHGPAGRGCTHPDLDRGFPSGLQSWSKGCRCLRQKLR